MLASSAPSAGALRGIVVALMSSLRMKATWRLVVVSCVCGLFPVPLGAQHYTNDNRDLALALLRDVAADVQKYYYDASLHGVDWDAKVVQAKENIEKADSLDTAISEIAALLDSLADSHTSLSLGPRSYVHDYGFRMKMIGERCYVVRVNRKSDAEGKGLMLGDEVLAVDELPVSRKTLWRIEYITNQLRPQPGLRLTLRGGDGLQRQLDVMAKIQPSTVLKYRLNQGINQRVRDMDDAYHLRDAQFFSRGDDLLVVKLPSLALSAYEVDSVLGKMRKHKGVVIDLRDNPGGFMDTLDRFLGGLFQNDRKVYDRVMRTSTKSVSVAGRHHDAFTGRLAILVDSESASASEVFARAVQLERRAFVLGDRSSGKVMESIFHPHGMWGTHVTEANLVMTDGKSLEHVGVEPDFVVLPTPQDLANRRDPALAKAAGLVGGHLSPEEAGSAFPNVDR
jgi:carboxyl-terminal processing protease